MKNVLALALLGVFASAVLGTPVRAKVARSLPNVFLSVLDEVKAKTRVAVLLPIELPGPFSNAKHAIVDKATADEYAVSLYYELDAGDAGFAALFEATSNHRYSPRELGNVREVKLAGGISGFFRPVNRGGSCAPREPLVGTGSGAVSDSAKVAFDSPREEPARDHNGCRQFGYPCRSPLVMA